MFKKKKRWPQSGVESAQRINKLLDDVPWQQFAVAEFLGVTAQAIYKWKIGESIPSNKHIELLLELEAEAATDQWRFN